MILTWYISGVLSQTGVVGSNYGMEYTLDKNYKPVRLVLRVKTIPSPDGTPLTVDINEKKFGYTSRDSIFPDQKPILVTEDAEYKNWSDKELQKDSVISLDVDQVNPNIPGKDLSVQLELEEA